MCRRLDSLGEGFIYALNGQGEGEHRSEGKKPHQRANFVSRSKHSRLDTSISSEIYRLQCHWLNYVFGQHYEDSV